MPEFSIVSETSGCMLLDAALKQYSKPVWISPETIQSKQGHFSTTSKLVNNQLLLDIPTMKTNDCFELSNKAAKHYKQFELIRDYLINYTEFARYDMWDADLPVKFRAISETEDRKQFS